jgi:hypothetical protein
MNNPIKEDRSIANAARPRPLLTDRRLRDTLTEHFGRALRIGPEHLVSLAEALSVFADEGLYAPEFHTLSECLEQEFGWSVAMINLVTAWIDRETTHKG